MAAISAAWAVAIPATANAAAARRVLISFFIGHSLLKIWVYTLILRLKDGAVLAAVKRGQFAPLEAVHRGVDDAGNYPHLAIGPCLAL
jgi:hypothetical protein